MSATSVLTRHRIAAAAVEGSVPEEQCELTTTRTAGSQSEATSPDGSPPLSPTTIPPPAPPHDTYTPLDDFKTSATHGSLVNRPITSSKSFSRPIPPKRPQAATRQPSKGGGVQMVLDEHGSWSNLADRDAPIVSDPNDSSMKYDKGGGSMLGFLSRKKGRDRSPKPKEPGVLGKLGARHIIG